jgi:hypothetical protein
MTCLQSGRHSENYDTRIAHCATWRGVGGMAGGCITQR